MFWEAKSSLILVNDIIIIFFFNGVILCMAGFHNSYLGRRCFHIFFYQLKSWCRLASAPTTRRLMVNIPTFNQWTVASNVAILILPEQLQ